MSLPVNLKFLNFIVALCNPYTTDRWQVEDIPLLDFYSEKAEKRAEQLDILNRWQEKRSILFLGYKQFSTIICGASASKVAAACQEKLLKVPSLLILDEGHTPRNEDTNVLESLAKVKFKILHDTKMFSAKCFPFLCQRHLSIFTHPAFLTETNIIQ
jgi:hypothetical protein